MKKVAHILRFAIVAMTVGFLFYENGLSYFLSGLFSLAVSGLLLMREKAYGHKFPGHLDALANGMLAMHVSGYAFGFYSKFDSYDKVEHFLAGIVIGLVGFAAITAFQAAHRQKISFKLCVLAAVAFAVLIGNIWELIEFSIDQLRIFNFSLATEHTQLQWGLLDTMNDIRLNFLGGALASFIGWLIYKNKDTATVKSELGFFVRMFS